MKAGIYLIAAGLLFEPAIFAQTGEKPPSAVKKVTDKVGEKVDRPLDALKDNVSGCLERGDESNPYFVRDPKTDKLTTVVGSSELAMHVNHKVKVRGEYEDSGRVFHAKEIETVASDCSLEAANSPASDATSRVSATPRAADNTGTNKEVGRQKDVTADDQNFNRADQDITRRIRRIVVDDKTLSTYAHNVKIITQNGQVTLKGPVRSKAERSRIAELAANVAGGSRVRDEMTVAP